MVGFPSWPTCKNDELEVVQELQEDRAARSGPANGNSRLFIGVSHSGSAPAAATE